MEDTFTVRFYTCLKRLKQRRKYERLRRSSSRRRRLRSARMGGDRHKIWRLKLLRRLKLRWVNLKQIVMKMKDMLINIQSNEVGSSVFVGGGFRQLLMPVPICKETDDKMIAEFYRSLMVKVWVH
ncbi:hypothetical protein SUGI_0111500 [Cryptomeria japonica]|nr:hypothetical protein SUGI_0111500 [Cryptomeria japonica]